MSIDISIFMCLFHILFHVCLCVIVLSLRSDSVYNKEATYLLPSLFITGFPSPSLPSPPFSSIPLEVGPSNPARRSGGAL